jgi:DNA-binding phage protein
MAEIYREDPSLAVDVVNSVLADGGQAELLIVLRQLAVAFGGIPTIAKQSHLNTTQLYLTLSPTGNPALRSLMAILKAMGLQLAVTHCEPPAKPVEG